MPNLDQTPTRKTKYAQVRRGDGGGDLGTTYAPGPPSSTYHRGQHVPTIDGSEGGFIGLLVGLLVLFIGCSVGVWLLLRRRHQKGRTPIPFFGKLVGGRTKETGGTFGRLNSSDRRGWVRTNDGDDESDEEGGGRAGGVRSRGVKLSNTPRSTGNQLGPYTNDSNPFATPSSTRLQDQSHTAPYGDAFSTRPSTDSLDEAVHAQYGGVPLHDPAESSDRHGHHEESMSPPVSPSFERGTKFKEGF